MSQILRVFRIISCIIGNSSVGSGTELRTKVQALSVQIGNLKVENENLVAEKEDLKAEKEDLNSRIADIEAEKKELLTKNEALEAQFEIDEEMRSENILYLQNEVKIFEKLNLGLQNDIQLLVSKIDK